MTGSRPGLRGWAGCLAAALAGTAVASLLLTMLLMGLPHAWDVALSWDEFGRRTGIIAAVVVPGSLAGRAVVAAGRGIRAWHGARERDRRPPPAGGGRHR